MPHITVNNEKRLKVLKQVEKKFLLDRLKFTNMQNLKVQKKLCGV